MKCWLTILLDGEVRVPTPLDTDIDQPPSVQFTALTMVKSGKILLCLSYLSYFQNLKNEDDRFISLSPRQVFQSLEKRKKIHVRYNHQIEQVTTKHKTLLLKYLQGQGYVNEKTVKRTMFVSRSHSQQFKRGNVDLCCCILTFMRRSLKFSFKIQALH